MTSAPPTLLLVDEEAPDGRCGGVQHTLGTLQAACAAGGVPVLRVPLEQVTGALRNLDPARTVIFVQQEGGLSAGYARRAAEWLSCGATVVEKNVFALPSPWRPRHPRYVMALMSLDGAYRLRLRGLLGGAGRPRSWIHLMNPCDPQSAAAPDPDGDVDLHFVRVGRPDLFKWSPFEVDFLRSAARAHPAMSFRLTLVGVSEEVARDGLPSNVDLVALPYLGRRDVDGHYARAHVYLHHSRIGETFGNTLAEAATRRLRIVLGSDPDRDCAPLEFLPEGSIVGKPGWLCRSAPRLVERLAAGTPPAAGNLPDGPAQVARLLKLVEDPAHRLLPEPPLRSSLGYVMRLHRHISGATPGDGARTAVMEVLRGYRRIRRSR